MANPGFKRADLDAALAAVEKYGNVSVAARALGIPDATLRRRYAQAKTDPAVSSGMAAIGTQLVPSMLWVKTKPEDGVSYSVQLKPVAHDDTLDRIAAAFSSIPAVEPSPPPEHSDADLLTAYLLADVHIGMMAWGRETGEDYDTAIACKRVTDWIGQCIAASPPAKTALILDVGDLLHADDQTNQTPRSKHVLDVDTRHYRTLDVTIAALAGAVDHAMLKHERVIVRILPGNHNPHSYLAVMFALAERYRSEPRVEVIKDPSEFFVLEWGKVMLAAHHGDKAKAPRMVHWLADEHAEVWGRTKHRFLFTGHLHHHRSEDIGGIAWEQLRAVTARDAYAVSHAYAARSQMQSIVYHRERGEVQRVKVSG